MKILEDLYTDFLLSSTRQTSATVLSRLLDGVFSHDQISRLLNGEEQASKALWQLVKPVVRAHETLDACLVFDDTIAEKEYTDENDLMCWHYDHSKGRSVRGVNLLTAFYVAQKEASAEALRVPVAYELVTKPEVMCELATKKVIRKSAVTKNEQMRSMIAQCIHNQLIFRYIIADSWFASVENMKYIEGKNKKFIFDLKSNRLAQLATDSPAIPTKKSSWTSIKDLDLAANTPTKVWLKDYDKVVLIVKQVFKDEDGKVEGVRFLVTNDLNLSYNDIATIYKKRWSVEEYHKSIKQNASLTKSPTRTVKTQSNHIFYVLTAYIKLEKLKFATHLNHFQLKAKLYLKATQAALSELNAIKQQYTTA